MIAYLCVAITAAAAVFMFWKKNYGLGMFFLLFPVFLGVFLVYDRGLIDREHIISAMAVYGVITFVLVMYGWAKGGDKETKLGKGRDD